MGELTLRWALNHCIRELAQHAGHAEILVDQIIAQRGTPGVQREERVVAGRHVRRPGSRR